MCTLRKMTFDELVNENIILKEKINQYIEALIWCSGSNDFNEGGKARAGWIKLCKPLIDENI